MPAPTTSLGTLRARIRQIADPGRARILQGFFKTGPGEYGEGDVFLGIRVPDLRRLTAEFAAPRPADTLRMLKSRFHEERLLALLFMVRAFDTGDDAVRRRVYGSYLANTCYINNWDLVDLSAPRIVGVFLAERSRAPLYRLARSASLWERRIAMVATHAFICRDDFGDALRIAVALLRDAEDLIHKATGWTLREVGKRNQPVLEAFLKKHCRIMPRTMLRYAIERLPAAERRRYLEGRFTSPP